MPNNQIENVHIFDSHWYSELKDKGPEAVSSWTKKKGINIFEKKLVFIPVHSNDHWSLAIIINPGLIESNSKKETDVSKDEEASL